MKNSYEMAEAMFGIVRAGCVAVPLNVSVTDDAVAGMIANSEAKALVASDEHVHFAIGFVKQLHAVKHIGRVWTMSYVYLRHVHVEVFHN